LNFKAIIGTNIDIISVCSALTQKISRFFQSKRFLSYFCFSKVLFPELVEGATSKEFSIQNYIYYAQIQIFIPFRPLAYQLQCHGTRGKRNARRCLLHEHHGGQKRLH
jgi:hypothetical protein